MYINRGFAARHGSSLIGRYGTRVLDNDALRSLAPSVFAVEKHESRSERYSYIPTIEVVDGMRENGFMPVFAKQGRSRVPGKEDFTKHMIRFRPESETQTVARLGGLYPEVVLINSHDGTSTYQVMAGLMRLVCLNGMMVADRDLTTVKVPHKGNVTDLVIEGSFEVISESVKAIQTASNWAGITLDRAEQGILADAAHQIRFADADGVITTPVTADQLLVPRRHEDRAPDLWTITNRVQENVIRGGLTARGRTADNRPRNVTTREVRGIDADVRINQALWLLSERMAALKTGAAA